MSTVPLQQRFADEMGQVLGPDFPSDIGLAVSGGGDSMAMLYLTHNWTRQFGVQLWIVTVDHGLRAESAAEAAMVAEECAALGWPHATLSWAWDGQGNVQDAARDARHRLIDMWRGPVKHVLFAHTQDDQAETFLMRLARGSGVDGLAGMQPVRSVSPHAVSPAPLSPEQYSGTAPQGTWSSGYQIVRPCLAMSREALRHYARTLKGRWVEDPTNDNTAYNRVRIRNVLKLLRQEGITTQALTQTAARLTRARDGLKARLIDAVDKLVRDAPLGQVVIDRDGFAGMDTETQLRLLTSALCYAANTAYRPRASASEAVLTHLLSGAGGTLHGAEVLVEKTQLRIVREAASVKHCKETLGTLWDGQWVIDSHDPDPLTHYEVKALGEDGWCQIPNRGGFPIPHRAALSLPAVWHNAELIACPILDVGKGFTSRRYALGRPDTGFKAFCVSH